MNVAHLLLLSNMVCLGRGLIVEDPMAEVDEYRLL